MQARMATAPLRLALAGGGTDVPWYYSQRDGGLILSAGIDAASRVLVARSYDGVWRLLYRDLCQAASLDGIEQHNPVAAACIRAVNGSEVAVQLASVPDVPGGTGLGSSGAFAVATIAALRALAAETPLELNDAVRREIAERACAVEIEDLGWSTGKQDQYTATWGGLRCLRIDVAGNVAVEDIEIPAHARQQLEDQLLLFRIPGTRSAAGALDAQRTAAATADGDVLTNLDEVKELAQRAIQLFRNADLDGFGYLLHEHWLIKQRRAVASHPLTHELYEAARQSGALGGKLVGAGGSGFLMVYTTDPERTRAALRPRGSTELPFKFRDTGVEVRMA